MKIKQGIWHEYAFVADYNVRITNFHYLKSDINNDLEVVSAS